MAAIVVRQRFQPRRLPSSSSSFTKPVAVVTAVAKPSTAANATTAVSFAATASESSVALLSTTALLHPSSTAVRG